MIYPSVNKDVQIASLKRELYAQPTDPMTMARKRKRRTRKSTLRKTKVIFLKIIP